MYEPAFHLTESHDLPLPAHAVWSVLSAYERDPEWRTGVLSMTASPPGPVEPGTTTVEELRIGGRTYRNVGEVVAVDEGRSITWRTVEGADANGRRSLEPVSDDRCRVTLEVTVRPRGAERLLAPVLARMLRRNLRGDLRRLEEIAAAGRPGGQAPDGAKATTESGGTVITID